MRAQVLVLRDGRRCRELPGWRRRIELYLGASDDTPEPLQWRTATGINRCVRCGVRVDACARPTLVLQCLIACEVCADAFEKADIQLPDGKAIAL